MNTMLQCCCPLLSLLVTFIIIIIPLPSSVNTIDLRPNCGFPGKPYRSKIAPEEKLVYNEGDVVSYQCADYWAPPQTRKCVNGVWTGAPARCGDFVKDLLMKDAQAFDMSYAAPRQIFHHTNMNITNTEWKYPNAFTSNRFKKARLRIDNDHEYLWRFNFTKPMTKLYVKVNFNFIDFVLLPQSVKESHRFLVEVEISPYRTCVLDYQNNNLWRENGNRIDTYFVCEAYSLADLYRDIASPSNHMTMRTKSSHNISHEFIALFFGRVYGNDTEPLCGEPETNYGQSFRANQEFRDYIIDCANKDSWIEVGNNAGTGLGVGGGKGKSGSGVGDGVDGGGSVKVFSHAQRCIGDMIWNGTQPHCIPTKYCSLDGVFAKMINSGQLGSSPAAVSKSGDNQISSGGSRGFNTDPTTTTQPPSSSSSISGNTSISPLVHSNKNDPILVDSITNYYHFIENQTIYAVPGTILSYSCASEDYILVGKDTRTCKPDQTWSGNEPVCKFIKSTNDLIDSSNTLLIIIVVMATALLIILIASCILFVVCTRSLRDKMYQAKLDAQKSNANANAANTMHVPPWQNEANLYDNIELNGNDGGSGKLRSRDDNDDGIYEIYEHIDDTVGSGNEYTPYFEPAPYGYGHVMQMHSGNNGSKDDDEYPIESDYVRMLYHDTSGGGGAAATNRNSNHDHNPTQQQSYYNHLTSASSSSPSSPPPPHPSMAKLLPDTSGGHHPHQQKQFKQMETTTTPKQGSFR